MLDRLYSRTLALAASRHAMWVMAAISFAESSFFPLPPDILLIPMILAQPRRAWLIAGVCTLASVAGGGQTLSLDSGTTGTITATGLVDNVATLTITQSKGATFQGAFGTGGA